MARIDKGNQRGIKSTISSLQKDIMDLFKHDAESKWKNDKTEENIGSRSRVLLDSSAPGEGGSISTQDLSAATEPRKGIVGKGKSLGNSGKGEHAVYGRRW